MEPITLHTSKTKNLFSLAGSLAFVFAGFWLLGHDAGSKVVAIASIAFFGLGAVVFSVLMLSNSSFLRLEQDGFTFVALFRATKVPWTVVERFHAGRIGLSSRVLIELVTEADAPSAMRRVALALSGHHGALPDTYGMTAKALAETMNRWKQQHLNNQSPQHQ